jgi:hypothetical protein
MSPWYIFHITSGQVLDLAADAYLGVEDLCVLAGMTTLQKYQGSYEPLAKSVQPPVTN